MRFYNIQILRFLAAAGVVLYHGHYYVGALVWNTPLVRFFDVRYSWGVLLFFAISGFVVSHSLSRTTPGRFLAMRLVRIYPAFWLAAAIVIVVRFATGGRPMSAGLLPALTLLPVGGADYPLGGVEWSLVYEVFFYAVLASIALVPARNAREWAMLAWLAAIGGAALLGWTQPAPFAPTFGDIALSALNMPFIAGVLAHSWHRHFGRAPIAILVASVPLALMAADRVTAPALQPAFLAAGFAALVLLAAELARRWNASPANPLVKLGDWSYGLYLVHVPVILAVLGGSQFAAAGADDAFVTAVSTALVAGCAYGWIETRMYRRNKAALERRWPKRRDG